MGFASSHTQETRRIPPKHKLWSPHAYQLRAVEYLLGQNAAALFLDPGLGKTSIVLEAFRRMQESGAARRMLVIAPLRVVQTVWQQEAQKWTEFRHLRFSVLHGDKKRERLRDDADVWLINPEGCQWLAAEFFGRPLPFDTVVIDELTKFKNHRAARAKALRPRLSRATRRFGLTGTPIPNGYMDLFSQFLMLDDGAALGQFITRYRDQYFHPDHDGFGYLLQPGAAARIEARIAPYVLRMGAKDYLDLPPLVDDIRVIELPPAARKTYREMKKSMIAELPQGTVTGANAGAVYSKLKQMANGAVYLSGDLSTHTVQNRQVVNLHDAKLDALEELVEELCGQPLLVAYEFNHDLARLQERFPNAPYIGAGQNAKKTQELVDGWNAGAIPLLFAHPASAGHGLNLQGGGCGHIAWFGPVWDLELYEQFIQRVHRQGTSSQRVVNHVFVARDTIDELVVDAVKDKATTQERLLRNLTSELIGDVARALATTLPTQAELAKARPVRIMHPDGTIEILRDADSPAAGNAVAKVKESSMLKLGKQGAAQSTPAPVVQAAAAQANGANRPQPKGWGASAAVETQEAQPARPTFGQRSNATQEVIEQRAAITEKLTHSNSTDGPAYPGETEQVPASVRAAAQFSGAILQQLEAPKGEADAMAKEVDAAADTKPRRTRTPKADTLAGLTTAPLVDPEAEAAAQQRYQRYDALQLALQYGQHIDPTADTLEVAKAFLAFLNGE